MAVQIEPPGQLQEFLDILLRRKWQILLPMLVFLSFGMFIGVVIPKKFLVETQIELREIFLGDGPSKAAQQQAESIAEDAAAQILSPKRITEVLEALKWPEYLTLSKVDKAEYRADVRENIRVIVPRKDKSAGSSFVTIEYQNVNKDRAQQFLKALRQAWIEQVVERQRTRYDVEYQALLERRAEIDKEYLEESRQKSDLRSDNDISPTQPTPGSNQQRGEDPIVDRFDDNSDRFEEVTEELSIAETTLILTRKQLAETEPEVPKTKVVEGLSFSEQIETLRINQADAATELDGIRPPHSRYKVIQRELEALDEQIRDLELRQTSSEVLQEFEPNRLYLDMQTLISSLELRIGVMQGERKALIVSLDDNRRDIRRLGEAYRLDGQHTDRLEVLKAAQEEIEIDLVKKKQRRDVVYGASGNPFQITQEVEEPGSPTEPNPFIIIVGAMILGLGIGFGTAMVAEFSKSCFKNPSEINRIMVAPVLGVIAPIVTRGERRRRLLKRFVVGTLSLLVIVSVFFVTWAWSYEPDLLGTRVNDKIEDFRELFV